MMGDPRNPRGICADWALRESRRRGNAAVRRLLVLAWILAFLATGVVLPHVEPPAAPVWRAAR